MAAPRNDRILAGSGDKENVAQDRGIISECPTLNRERKKKKNGGFNLRKSIAWNPAFFTEEGVLDNVELSVLSGSQMKADRSPGSGASAATATPLCRFGRSGNTSVLKEVGENSPSKLSAKYRCRESKGRQLFSTVKTSERGEPAGIQDKRSERSTKKCTPQPPAGYAQKKVANLSAAVQLLKTPKKSQPSIPAGPTSASFATSISQPNKKLPPTPVKTGHPHRVDGLLLKSKIKPTSLAKSSRPKTDKDVMPAVTATRAEASGSAKCESFSTHSQNSPSSSIHIPASTFAKPSALRMPSPSVGFFSPGKAPVSHCDTAPENINSCFTGNTSSFLKPPRYKQPRDVKGRTCQAPATHGETTQGNAKGYFTGNTSSLVKPPRYKQPEDCQSRLCLTKQMPTDSPADAKPPVHPVTNESPLSTFTSSLSDLKHSNVFSAEESLSKGIITYSAKSRNTNNQQIRNTDFFSAGDEDIVQPCSLEKNRSSRNGVPNAYNNASHGEGKGIVSRIEPIENPHSLKAIFSSNIEPVVGSCYHEVIGSSTKPIVGNKFSFSCISSQVCTPDDLNCQSKSDNSSAVAKDLENSLSGDIVDTTYLSEGNNHTLDSDFVQDILSCDRQNTECSALVESVESTICADPVPQCGTSIDVKQALANGASDLYGSLCNEVQPTSAEEPNTDGRIEHHSDDLLITKEAQLFDVGSEFDDDNDYGTCECSPTKPAASMCCMVQETQVAYLNDSEAVTIDSKTDSYVSVALERQPAPSEEPNTEDNMELDANDLSALEDASPTEKNKPVKKSGTNTILKDHLKHLVPFTEEWLAAMEACGEEVLEQKTGAVQNSPTDKTAPEPSPWSPVKRKAQDVGPFDCTKYSKSIRTSDTP